MQQPLFPDWQQRFLAQPLERQVAQLFVVRASGHLFDHQIRYPQWEADRATLQHWVQDLGVGGVIFLGGSAAELARRCQQLQDWAEMPLLLAADVEEGVGQRFDGATWMPPPMALGAIALTQPEQAIHWARRLGEITALEAQGVGLNWVLAPVVDVNNNPDNPVINVRAFGEQPEQVCELIRAFIQGCQTQPVLATAKHFPGHGDTATDSHLALPVIPHDRDRLDAVELAPFRAAIAEQVASIMTAHLHLPSLDPTDPATLSAPILTDLLRGELGYDGLIVTDALVMAAIAQRYGECEAPVRAFEAGADILLMPGDLEGAIAAIVEAIRTGRIPQARLEQSLERIWRAKMRTIQMPEQLSFSHAWDREQPPGPNLEALAQPESRQLLDDILRASQLSQGALPLQLKPQLASPPGPVPLNLLVVDTLLESPFLGRHTPAIALPQRWGYDTHWVDNQSHLQLDTQRPTLLQLFIRGNPFRGSAGLTQTAQLCLDQLLSQGSLQALVLYGSPYAWRTFVSQLPADIPAVFSYGHMPEAQAIALGTLVQGSDPGEALAQQGASPAFTD